MKNALEACSIRECEEGSPALLGLQQLWPSRHQPSLLMTLPTRTLVAMKQMFFLGTIEYSSVTKVFCSGK
ncbi:hypothetical protein Y032_0017g3443 [Ancylostoma ceylanicum]|uniref:Uncharacterized protein n=1 Tax=Ancylostoma ceylanicum TaxID=53326 RepID=A0A016V6I4_9BILA|nr:hypothetical protein Y032_0017g3443 [Ancylostoma ceylanicum]